MTVSLTDFNSFKAYFQDLATGVHHHKEIDGYLFGDNAVVQNENRSNIAARVLWAEYYRPFTYSGDLSDNTMKTKTASLTYLKVAASLKFEDEDQAYHESEKVIDQIVAKMLQDKRALGIYADFALFKAGPAEFTFGSTKYIGCKLEFNFKDNAGMQYDASKWQ